MSKPVILTGLRANNDLTIGNYFGALLPMIDMATTKASDYQINLFVPDLHSFTTPVDHRALHEQILHNVRLFAAAGLPLDNPDIHIYRQSYIPAHSELTWILDCFTGFGEMRRMTQFKDKSGIGTWKDDREYILKHLSQLRADLGDNYSPQMIFSSIDTLTHTLDVSEAASDASVGLFNYPVLMAADILLYNAMYIPVGDDQTQHLEYTRDIAIRLNNKFKKEFPEGLFTVPIAVSKQHEFFGKDQGLRIMDLVDPTKKMSKSDDTGKGVIFLGDTPQAAAKKIMGATTDSLGSVHYDRKAQPGITNLLDMLALLQHRPVKEVAAEWEGNERYGDLKKTVASEIEKFLTTFQANLAQQSDKAIMQKLESSEKAMNETANRTLLRAQQAVGLRSL